MNQNPSLKHSRTIALSMSYFGTLSGWNSFWCKRICKVHFPRNHHNLFRIQCFNSNSLIQFISNLRTSRCLQIQQVIHFVVFDWNGQWLWWGACDPADMPVRCYTLILKLKYIISKYLFGQEVYPCMPTNKYHHNYRWTKWVEFDQIKLIHVAPL